MKDQKMIFSSKGETLYLIKEQADFEAIQANDKEVFYVSLNKIDEKGLFHTLIEACKPELLGFDITIDSDFTDEEFLYRPNGYYAVISLDEHQEDDFIDFMFNNHRKATILGHTTKGDIRIDDKSIGQIEKYL